MSNSTLLALEVFGGDSTVGNLIKAFLAFFGLIFVVFQLIGAFKAMASGKGGDAAKKIVVAIVIGAFCFRPQIVEGIINLFAAAIDSVISNDVTTIVEDEGITVDI